MTRRSAWKPTYVAQPETKPMTFAQKHKFLVISVHKDRPNDTHSARFSNEHCAASHIEWMTSKGYFARIV